MRVLRQNATALEGPAACAQVDRGDQSGRSRCERISAAPADLRGAPPCRLRELVDRHPRVFRRRRLGSLVSNSRGSARFEQKPNQALEPTREAVTPRAFASPTEGMIRNLFLSAARGAPAPRVAHL
jgi:hypothetical protein